MGYGMYENTIDPEEPKSKLKVWVREVLFCNVLFYCGKGFSVFKRGFRRERTFEDLKKVRMIPS